MNPDDVAARCIVLLSLLTIVFVHVSACTKNVSANLPVDLHLDLKTRVHSIVCGDARFHDPSDTDATNPPARVAIAAANPASIRFASDRLQGQ